MIGCTRSGYITIKDCTKYNSKSQYPGLSTNIIIIIIFFWESSTNIMWSQQIVQNT